MAENIQIVQLSTLDLKKQEASVGLFVGGFYSMFSFTKDKHILRELFFNSLDFSMIYVCLYGEEVVGLLGLANNKKRPVHFEKSICQRLLGRGKGFIVYKQMNAIMERPAVKGDKDTYIDYLTTDQNHRGKGIATKLIHFVCNEFDYEDCYIEVLSKNENAKRLYESLGFTEYKRVYNPFVLSQGLGALVKMKLHIQ